MRGGGDGSAITETVSATLAVIDVVPLPVETDTVSPSLAATSPCIPGSIPASFR